MSIKAWLTDPKRRIKVHTALAGFWGAATLAITVLAYLFPAHPFVMAVLVFMSGYALFGEHWAAREGAMPSDGGES